MPATVIAFSGQIKSGKTTVSQVVADALGCGRASFGDQVRKVVDSMGLPIVRENLQRVGESLVATQLDRFCLDVIGQVNANEESHLVIDGIRHLEAAESLKRLVAPKQFRWVYVDTDASIREQRHTQQSTPNESLKVYEQHSTEQQVASRLRQHADLVVDGSSDLSALVKQIVALVDRQR